MLTANLIGILLSIFLVPTSDIELFNFITKPPVEERQAVDYRIEKLESFLKVYNCPQPYYSEVYLEAADKYNLDYRLLPVISVKESGCGKQVFRNNNWWGYGDVHFASIEEGIFFITQQLSEGKYYKNKSLEDKLKKYNSINKDYPAHAAMLMQQIE